MTTVQVVVASLTTLVALVLLCSAPAFLVRRFGFLGRSERTYGEVAGRSLEHSGDGVSTARLQIRYRAKDGREYTLDQKSEHDRKVGEAVEVLYDPDRPEHAYLKFGMTYVVAVTLVMLVIGVGLALFALMMWRA
ncbi:DUF3592 domain-containing protein [Actinomadura sp. 7K507]|uniref:DUF3592 domain-containing protein n=1 Tax=Actinomadura sp. 7K507 TaxID=2530365 RepID=UPI0014044624|nr:DUF3592 domain-containing protein [Actinomadura sp. 7K507]